jgi:hypothetical protein
VKPCGWGLRAGSGKSEIKTPLHPNAVHNHATYVIVTGHTDSQGRPYEIHYCHCGEAFRFVPLGWPTNGSG